ncbi:MAG: glycosyltransferase family 4 protein [Oscillatoriales cyanobacterium RM2_1_1]|nr:glycosyltransferase family 4 protein [Oscillatoriales cyanobacterium SM2_3_0]NJO45888.1 glycosyltransferase family 4 protein [Oscillatoriales cyanobacterium RM2_1_1]
MKNSSAKKVSIIVSDLSESGAGRWAGGGVRPFLLGRALQALDYDVEIVGLVEGNRDRAIQATEISIIPIASYPYPKFALSAWQLLRHIQGDILYPYKLKPTSFGLSLLKQSLSSLPLILDIDDWELSWHGGETWQYRPGLMQLARDVLKPGGELRNPDHPLYLKWIEAQVRRADAITTHNQFLQQKFGGICLPNGKDVHLFNPDHYPPQASKAKYNLSAYRVLMFPGAPRPYKGVEDVLSALDLLDDPTLRLVIVGGSPYDDYDDQLQKRWGRWLIKLPKVPYPQMPEVVAAADVIVVPQRDDPAALAQFPLKLTDGMAMAKPILASRVGDIPSILEGTGYLVDPGAPQQLADQIQWIFENLVVAQVQGQQARARCVAHYSLEAMTEILAQLLVQLRLRA